MKFSSKISLLREEKPLIFNLTNYVAANDTANALLAIGARPLMSSERQEAKDLCKICDALSINIGTADRQSFKAMKNAVKAIVKYKKPAVLDPVGLGASSFRNKAVLTLIKKGLKNDKNAFSVIKGNASEIKTLYSLLLKTEKKSEKIKTECKNGVDVSKNDAINDENLFSYIKMSKKISEKTKSIIFITGKYDIITDFKNQKTGVIKNGNSLMEKITGTGCMLSGVTAAFLAIAKNENEYFDACLNASAVFKISGDLTKDEKNMTFKNNFIDCLCKISDEVIKNEVKIELS